jgi:hypothetical protein
MATQTIALARFAQELVRYEVDYDDVTLLVTALRCINNSDQGPAPAPSSGRVWLINDTSGTFRRARSATRRRRASPPRA